MFVSTYQVATMLNLPSIATLHLTLGWNSILLYNTFAHKICISSIGVRQFTTQQLTVQTL